METSKIAHGEEVKKDPPAQGVAEGSGKGAETGGGVPAAIVPKEGWSWGAFIFHLPFLIAVKRYALMWWYLLALVPGVNLIFIIAFAIYLGTTGHRLGAEGGQFSSQAEYEGYFKGVDHAGKIIFFATVFLAACAIIIVIGGMSFAAFFGTHAQAFRQ